MPITVTVQTPPYGDDENDLYNMKPSPIMHQDLSCKHQTTEKLKQ